MRNDHVESTKVPQPNSIGPMTFLGTDLQGGMKHPLFSLPVGSYFVLI